MIHPVPILMHDHKTPSTDYSTYIVATGWSNMVSNRPTRSANLVSAKLRQPKKVIVSDRPPTTAQEIPHTALHVRPGRRDSVVKNSQHTLIFNFLSLNAAMSHPVDNLLYGTHLTVRNTLLAATSGLLLSRRKVWYSTKFRRHLV